MTNCVKHQATMQVYPYSKVTLSPLPGLPKHVIAALENAEGVRITRLGGDAEALAKYIEHSPIMASPQLTEAGNFSSNKFHIFAGFRVLNLLRLLPIEELNKIKLRIVRFTDLSTEEMCEVAHVDVLSGSISSQVKAHEFLKGENWKNPPEKIYKDMLRRYSNA